MSKTSKLLKLVKRTLRISGNTELSAVIAAELSRPLLAHPGDTEAYVRAFLHNGGMEFDASSPAEMDANVSSVMVSFSEESRTAFIDVSGVLVAKEMSVPCASSPVSYEAIKYELSKLMQDPTIDNIVALFHSGGGVVSQMVDVSDYIFSQRGKGKKLYAMADDIAYSAAYGIASAFDEIWVTRTSGVGSIGVVARFEERSKANEAEGKTVEYLYAGDKKIFGNRDEPLGDEARADMMAEVQHHYDLFTATVARNLGMSVESIVATQAATYVGQNAIDAGLAHKLGTLDDLMEHIDKEATMSNKTDAQKKRDEQRTSMQATIDQQKVDLQASEDAMELLADDSTIETGESDEGSAQATADAAQAKIDADNAAEKTKADADAKVESDAEEARVAGINAVVAAAGLDASVASNFVKSKMSLDDVRADITASTAGGDDNGISSKLLGAQSTKNATAAKGWGDALGTTATK